MRDLNCTMIQDRVWIHVKKRESQLLKVHEPQKSHECAELYIPRAQLECHLHDQTKQTLFAHFRILSSNHPSSPYACKLHSTVSCLSEFLPPNNCRLAMVGWATRDTCEPAPAPDIIGSTTTEQLYKPDLYFHNYCIYLYLLNN